MCSWWYHSQFNQFKKACVRVEILYFDFRKTPSNQKTKLTKVATFEICEIFSNYYSSYVRDYKATLAGGNNLFSDDIFCDQYWLLMSVLHLWFFWQITRANNTQKMWHVWLDFFNKHNEAPPHFLGLLHYDFCECTSNISENEVLFYLASSTTSPKAYDQKINFFKFLLKQKDALGFSLLL